MKKYSQWIFLLFIFLLVWNPAFGESDVTFNFDVNMNQSVVSGRIGGEWDTAPNLLSVGISSIYDKKDYTLFGADVSLGNPFIVDEFRINMGLKAVGGTVDHSPENAEAGAVALMLGGIYEVLDMNVPLEISGFFAGAMGPTCFMDADEYLELETRIGVYVLESRTGQIYTGYRYLRLGFDDEFKDADLSKNEVFLGIRLAF